MQLKDVFQSTMLQTTNLALATSNGNLPNVRVVTYGYDPARPGKVYVSSFQGNRKNDEISQNPNVALSPLVALQNPMVQVRIFGKARKSTLSLTEFAGMIMEKDPGYAENLDAGIGTLDVFEVDFDEAWVTIGMTDAVLMKI